MTILQKAIKAGAICFAIFLIFNIVSGILMLIALITGFEPNGTDENDMLVVEEINTYDDVTTLDIELKYANLEIINGNEFKVESSGFGDNLVIKKSNNSIKLEEKSGFFWERKFKGKIVVYIPSNIFLKQIDLESGVGSIQLDSLEALKFELDQGAGKISMENCTFDETNINGGAGKIDISNSNLGRLDLDAGVGEVTIDAELYGISRIDSGVGDIDLTLKGGESLYNIYIEKGVGSIKINNKEYDNNTTYGNGPNKVEISGGIGSIDIKFN